MFIHICDLKIASDKNLHRILNRFLMHCTVCEFDSSFFFSLFRSLEFIQNVYTMQRTNSIYVFGLFVGWLCAFFLSFFVLCVTKCIPLVFDSANDHLNKPAPTTTRTTIAQVSLIYSMSRNWTFVVLSNGLCCSRSHITLFLYRVKRRWEPNQTSLVHSNIWLVTSIYIHSPGRFFMSI